MDINIQSKQSIINSIVHSQFRLASAFATFFDACLVTFVHILSTSPLFVSFAIFRMVSKSTFTWEAKWTQIGMRFNFDWKFHFGVQSALYLCSHQLRRNEIQNCMDFILIILTEMKFQIGIRFLCGRNLPQTKWISADSLDVAFNAHVHLKLNASMDFMSVILTEMKFMWTELVFTPVWNLKLAWARFASHVKLL